MTKLNYFDALETLADLVKDGVSSVWDNAAAGGKKNFKSIREECDKLLFSLEAALFSDFITPLERDNIAEFAHSLYRIIEKTGTLLYLMFAEGQRFPALIKRETEINKRLCAELTESIRLLKRIKKPDSIPDLAAFRNLAGESAGIHEEVLLALKSGKINSSHTLAATAAGDLRLEITKCFDKLVEIMLNNI